MSVASEVHGFPGEKVGILLSPWLIALTYQNNAIKPSMARTSSQCSQGLNQNQ